MKTRLWWRMNLFYVACALLITLSAQTRSAAQVITGFDPMFGSPGDPVTISGSQFAPGALQVDFNGVVDPTAAAPSPGMIFAKVPPGATTGPITVRVGSKSVSSAQDFTVIGLGPFITGFDPPFGAVDDAILISGLHLVNPNQTSPQVHFAGVRSKSVIANAAGTQLTARVPAGATNGPITVTTTLGSSNTPVAFNVIGPEPFVTDFRPRFGNEGEFVDIDGVHFLNVTQVKFGTRQAAFFIQSETRIQAQAPAGVASGPITVISPLGTNVTPELFYVPPVVANFSPLSGRAGTNIVIHGTNLLGAISVRVGDVPADFLAPTNNTNIFVTIPTGASSGKVRVGTPAGSSQSSTNFRFLPTVSGFAPAAEGPGAAVTIEGANLNEGLSNVLIGGISARFTNAALSKVTAFVPTNALTGPISVSTTNGQFVTSTNFYAPIVIANVTPTAGGPGTVVTVSGRNFTDASSVAFGGVPVQDLDVTNNFIVEMAVPPDALSGSIQVTTPWGSTNSPTVFYAPPAVTGFDPVQGLPGTNVTVTGVNFLGATAVLFGGVAATNFTVTTNTVITAKVPNGAQTGPITVIAPAGTNSSLQQFTVAYTSDLGIAATASPVPAIPGSLLLYSVSVTNVGPFAAPAVRANVVLPPQAPLVQVSLSRGTVTTNGTQLVWLAGEVAAGVSALASISVRPSTAGTLEFSAVISSDNPDPHPANNTTALSIPSVSAPELSIISLPSDSVQLSWAGIFTNFQVQYRNVLGSGDWSNTLTAPILTNNLNIWSESSSLPSRYYRLRN